MSAPVQPTLRTERLVLRPLTLVDAPAVQRLAGDREIADTTLSVPHPYEDGMAETWINTLAPAFERGESAVFALTRADGGELLGAIGLAGINRRHSHAELGYWIGKRFWGQGFASEAAAAMVNYAFGELGLHRVYAMCFSRNPASARVMQKAGLTFEGRRRQHVRSAVGFEDVDEYGVVAE
jgi:RimJ/RimL family protein N-acetyltransferase